MASLRVALRLSLMTPSLTNNQGQAKNAFSSHSTHHRSYRDPNRGFQSNSFCGIEELLQEEEDGQTQKQNIESFPDKIGEESKIPQIRKKNVEMEDKRKLETLPEPRRNQRRATSEIPDEESNREALSSLASMILKGQRVVIITGAGLSCASGIPAFRTSKSVESKYLDDGTIWGRHVEAMGTRSTFSKDPLNWYTSFWLQSFAPVHMKKQPSLGHEALSELTSLFPKISIITQNVDGLQQSTIAAWDHKNRLIEAHGRVGLYRCSSLCKYDDEGDEADAGVEVVSKNCPFAEDDVIPPAKFTQDEQHQLGHTSTLTPMTMVPRCPHCNEVSMPLALLFDEDYTDHDFYQFEKLREWFDEAEVFMFVGTSFSVTLTSLALQVARAKAIPMFNFNTDKDIEKAATKTLKWKNICGKAEELLPSLLTLVKREQPP